MDSALTSTVPTLAETSKITNTGFRLGDEEHISDASDSDQSATSKRSLSPSRKEGTRTKSRKKRERKEIGALTGELDDLLGAAFSSSNANLSATGAVSGLREQENGDVAMQADSAPADKKMSKRTRQNLAKMEARKQKRGNKRENNEQLVAQTQAAAAERRGMSLDEYRKQRRSGGSTLMTQERRRKKEGARAKRAAAEADKMDIG